MRTHPKILGVIPARLDSTRLPGKVLRDIAGRPMLYWVYRNARQSPLLSDLIVATDSEQVQDFCSKQSIPVMMTGRHPSGSDRLHEVMLRTDGDVYVNIQGDEPMLRPDHLELLLTPFLEGTAEVTTLKVAIDSEAAQHPGNVKVVTDNSGRALYFSRHPIPYDRDKTGAVQYYKHLGLYAYTRAALALFHSLPQSSLELAEKLEQLRFLQNGVCITVAETKHDTIGVDTEEDLQRVSELFAGLTDPCAF
ncbi:MAG TPA: 3-deoxy-manno-octulosonate cytidylyltransferase [Acidobacteriota bacterium]|nr:3-deoxy-manno-octulosonate cytidylyltransferase [Acidobacteriota bacterium]